MPILVVGADTVQGAAITRALEQRHGEKRAFVTDPVAGTALKERSWKVAIGDVSDGSHLGGAALGCFSAVLVAEAAFDERERAFAPSPASTIGAWAAALAEAGVQRIIWLEDERVEGAAAGFAGAAEEVATVPTAGQSPDRIAAEVARLDDLASLGDA